jgi:hypothetical protein
MDVELGFALTEIVPALSDEVTDSGGEVETGSKTPTTDSLPEPPTPPADTTTLPPSDLPGVDHAWIRWVGRRQAGRLGKRDEQVKPLEVKDLPASEPPSPEPLFFRPWQRGILQELVGMPRPVGDIDVERLVDSLAHARPIVKLPRRSVMGFEKGVQVLVDVGESMRPFADDSFVLLRELLHLVSPEQVALLTFEGLPTKGTAPLGEWPLSSYQPPQDGRPVLLITDLGVRWNSTGSGTAADWLAFASAVRAAGSTVTALVPYRRERIHPRLRRAIAVVTWDRRTSSAVVRRIRKPRWRTQRH